MGMNCTSKVVRRRSILSCLLDHFESSALRIPSSMFGIVEIFNIADVYLQYGLEEAYFL